MWPFIGAGNSKIKDSASYLRDLFRNVIANKKIENADNAAKGILKSASEMDVLDRLLAEKEKGGEFFSDEELEDEGLFILISSVRVLLGWTRYGLMDYDFCVDGASQSSSSIR